MQLNPLINFNLQKYLFLQNPLSFLKVIFQTFSDFNDIYLTRMIGLFGWLDYGFNPIIYIFYIFILGYVIYELLSYKKIIFSRSELLGLITIQCLVIFSIFLALYFQYTPVGFPVVLGIQGRYFLILCPFIILLIQQIYVLFAKGKIEKLLMIIIIIVVSIQSFRSVYLRYYGDTDSIKKQKDLINLISNIDDINRLKYLTIDKQVTFWVSHKGKNLKVAGFKFYFTTNNQRINATYKYSFRDKNCKKEFTKGKMDSSKLMHDSAYFETFGGYTVDDDSVCIIIEPEKYSSEDHFINIIFIDQEPQIQLLYNN